MIREPCNATSAMVVSDTNCSTVFFDVGTLLFRYLVNFWDRQAKRLHLMYAETARSECCCYIWVCCWKISPVHKVDSDPLKGLTSTTSGGL